MDDLKWIESVLVNDESSTDDELIVHFEEEGRMSTEAAMFYVGQRSAALQRPLEFKVEGFRKTR